MSWPFMEGERVLCSPYMKHGVGGLNFAVDKWRYKETGDNYNDDIYLCVTVCFVDAD